MATLSTTPSDVVARDDQLITLLVVDDCRLYREGLVSLLEREPDIGEVHGVTDASTLEATLSGCTPDVILVNLASKDTGGLIALARERAVGAAIIAIGVGDSDQEVVECAEAGVAAFLLRSEPLHHLTSMVRAVMAEGATFSPRASAALMRRLAQLADGRDDARHQVPVLTEREDQVFRLLDAGLSNQQIANRLGIEQHTVKNHVHNILVKLGVSRRGEAVAAMRALRAGARGRLAHGAQ
jgi:DNA-binding NarL/FixJ family response regulator